MRKIIISLLLIGIFAGCKSVQSVAQYEIADATIADTSIVNVQIAGFQCELADTGMYFATNDKKQRIYAPGDSVGFSIDLNPDDSLRLFVNEWYSKHLHCLCEPILYNRTGGTTNIIRFTMLETWGNPVSYRIENNSSGIYITYSKTDGQGGYETGKRVEHETKEISVAKWDAIIAKMDSIDFCNIETHAKNMFFEGNKLVFHMHTDGAEWIFETFINGRYHLVTRNSPDNSGTSGDKGYAELCNLIVQSHK
ncbi:MAG: hypothetical protein LBT50_08870, partial [Prevotellaceae bacterium]|nr:hypothetical protein [Prevotellaceae bacterium]